MSTDGTTLEAARSATIPTRVTATSIGYSETCAVSLNIHYLGGSAGAYMSSANARAIAADLLAAADVADAAALAAALKIAAEASGEPT
jgi:hypothetical protein